MDQDVFIETNTARDWLEARGFGLFSVMDPADWSDDIGRSLQKHGIVIQRGTRVVLVGAAGKVLWKHTREKSWGGKHPIDRYSVAVVQELASVCWGIRDVEVLYPGTKVIPLQQLCRLAGWSHSSPLGLDIHPHFGTWFACRAAFLVQAHLQLTPVEVRSPPCEDCLDQPCQSACPAGAVHQGTAFSLDTCAGYRLQSKSPCVYQCFARFACPVGAEWRYTEEQLKYHGERSLVSLRRAKFDSVSVLADSNRNDVIGVDEQNNEGTPIASL